MTIGWDKKNKDTKTNHNLKRITPTCEALRKSAAPAPKPKRPKPAPKYGLSERVCT